MLTKMVLSNVHQFVLTIIITFSMDICTIVAYSNRSISQTVAVRIWDNIQCKDNRMADLKQYILAPENRNDECKVSETGSTEIRREKPILTLHIYRQMSSSTLRRVIHYCSSKENQLNVYLECNISATAFWGRLCLADDNCDTENAVCSMEKAYGRCVCKEGHRVDNSRRKCTKVNVFLGGLCENSENCGQMNTRCHINKCTCAVGFSESYGICVKGTLKPGEACSIDTECGQYQTCYNKTCSCQAGYVQIESVCIEGKKALGSACQYLQQCTETPHANQCVGNSTHLWCSCDMKFVEKNYSCIPIVTIVNRGQQEKTTRPIPCSQEDNYDIYTVIDESTESVQGIPEIPVKTTPAHVNKCRFDTVNTERSNPSLGSVFGSGISGMFVGPTLTAILFVVYNKSKGPDVNQENSHQPSNERHRNYSDAIYRDPVESIESNRKWEKFQKRILNQESLRRESQQNHSHFDQTIYSHLNEKDETCVNLETSYDPVNFAQNAAKQPVSYDVCMAGNVTDTEKSFYEFQEAFEPQ